MKIYFIKSLWISLLVIGLNSCQKAEIVNLSAEFVNVYFDADQTALRDNGTGVYIAAKYNGNPIDWNVNNKKIKVIPGVGKFQFYDTRNGKIVAEKVVDVKAGSNHSYKLFQPTMEAPVAFIDPNGQETETPAPQGHIKLKIANYAQDLIPFENLDIKVSISYFDADFNTVIDEVGTIKGIKNSIDLAEYITIPDGLPDPLPEYGYNYIFDFINGDTGEPLLNYGGTSYSNMAFSPGNFNPIPSKNLFTLYLISKKTWGEAPPFIKKGDDFYEIATNNLFVN